MIAAVWGVFIWKEFKGANKGIYVLLGLMFCLFVSGLGFIIVSGEEKAVDNRIEVILDTDANNELDDQHAIAYLLLNENTFNVSGITINATRNGGDVTEHGREAERVIALVNKSDVGIPVVLGANGGFEAIKGNLDSQDYDGRSAVEFIINQARQKTPEDKLTLIAIGKLTNVALALLAEPSIIPNIRLVWLGANYPEPGETNLVNDIPAMNYVLSTDVEMEIALCSYHTPYGTDAVRITKAKAQEIFAGMGPHVEKAVPGRHGGEFHCFGDYSVSLFEHIRYWDDIQSRALYDMAAVAIVKHGEWAEKIELPAPTMIDGKWVDQPQNPRTVSMWKNFDKDKIIEDFIQTLNK
jgi:inosine-uridine nucleoside N-ribohydrolase